MKTEFIIDKFIDYTGKEREFIIAAVSVPVPDCEVAIIPDAVNGHKGDCYIEYDDKVIDCEKLLLLGVSVRHEEDKYSEEIGKTIAVGKALKYKGKQIVASSSGLINTIMVKALLQQEAEYFKRDPGSYIAGYNKRKYKYLASK